MAAPSAVKDDATTTEMMADSIKDSMSSSLLPDALGQLGGDDMNAQVHANLTSMVKWANPGFVKAQNTVKNQNATVYW